MQLDAINLARARCVLTFKRYIKKKTAPHLLGRIQVFNCKKKIQAPQVIEKIVETSLNLFSILKYTLNSLYVESEQKIFLITKSF
jgi:hypothetical protein